MEATPRAPGDTLPRTNVATRAGTVTSVGTRSPDLPRPGLTQLTGFVGREAELAELRSLLATGRLVTLTGGGGSGKTRLAAELVSRFGGDFTDGVAWVDLADIVDDRLLARHVSSELGLVEEMGRTPTDALVGRLSPLRTLVVLDNCEHLVSACADLCHALLAACPGLKILATSREALGIGGETAWLVPPLTLPPSDGCTVDEVGSSEAVQLFVDRAKAVRTGFALDERNLAPIVQICRRLDGIPLALELAAARVKVLTPDQIAARLDDVFGLLTTNVRGARPRHRTLREAIDWSHALLAEDERILFRRLSVFRGGWTLDAAECITADGLLPPSSILDRLSGLVDKSLVRADLSEREGRYALLEPVRQYAEEHLVESGECDALHDAHAQYYLELAESLEPHIRGGTRHSPWMNRLEGEHGNLRAALQWLGGSEARLADQLRLDTALLWFHFALGLFKEPRQRMTESLSRAGELDPGLRGRALTAVGHLAIWLGDHSATREPLTEGVALLRRAHDPDALSMALTGLAATVGMAGDGVSAHAYLDEAQEVLGGRAGAQSCGFPRLILFAIASYWRGVVSQVLGDVPRARASFELCVDVARSVGRHPTIAHPLAALGRLLARTGELDAAETSLAESLTIHAANDDRWGLVQVMEGGAYLAYARRDHVRAARVLAASDRLREAMGATVPPHEQADRAGLIDSIRSELGEAAFAEAWSKGRSVPLTRISAEVLGVTHPLDGGGRPGTVTQPDGPVAPERDPMARPAPRHEDEPSEPPAPRVESAEASLALGSASSNGSGEPVDLRVSALGPLEIECLGQIVDGGRWGSAKPRELLLYLLCHAAGATRDQIGLALWPDASSDRVSNSFHVTLHRLRKALGRPEWIVASGDRYRVSPDLRYDFDATVFKRDVTIALRDAPGAPDAFERLERSLAIYRGPFLEGEVVGDWHLEFRDRLASLYLDGLLALGAEHRSRGRWTEAADAYRRVVAADDLHEPAYRELMTCLARSGDRPQAMRLYQRLATLLETELDARPEDETVALFERLRSAEPV